MATASVALTAERVVASTVQLRLLGWPEDGPRLDLDHERFAYAGHFGTGRTGLAVALVDDAVDGRGDASDDDRDDATGADAPDLDSTEVGSSELEPTELDASDVLAAASFDPDRAAAEALRIRYVAVREDHRGEGIGPRLLGFVVDRARERGFDAVRIGVNNPAAYQACYRAGFAFTGEESGMGELVLEAPTDDRSAEAYRNGRDRSVERYRAGLERFTDRDLPDAQRAVVERNRDAAPPSRRG